MGFLAAAAVFLAYLLLRWRWSGRPMLESLALDFARLYASLWHRWSGRRSPLAAQGPAILVSNHTCSADPAFLLAGSPRLFGFLASRAHYNLHPLTRKLLNWMGCVPVTRNGRDAAAARAALRRLAEGKVLCVFPEGNLSGVRRGRLRAAKHGVAFLALASRAPVYPAYIAGGPRTEKLLQAWLWPWGRAVRVHYGPPADLSPYYDKPRTRKLLAEVTEVLMRQVAALAPAKGGHHEVRNGKRADRKALRPL